MSQITRCPACQTLFKVVPDQLRVSAGWVRCGQCHEVFEAPQNLLTQAPAAALPVLERERHPAEVAIGKHIAATGSGPAVPDLSAPMDLVRDPEPERMPEPARVTFLRAERGRSSWHKPLARLFLAFLSAALLLGLAAQLVLHERDRIAALHPGLKPWLLAFCAPLKCSLSALKEKNSIVIDGASFTRIAGDAYRLGFTLRNTSSIALAVPAVELTLTDSTDQALLRRVFSPTELDLKSGTLAAGADSSVSLPMAVNQASTSQPIVGYRLYIFYP